MSQSSGEEKPQARLLLAELIRLGASHLIGLPDNGSAALFRATASHPGLTLVQVSREGEAFAIASGLWIGGCRPVVLMQNTGLLESGDSLRGTALRMGVPLLSLIGYRGRASVEGLPGGNGTRAPSPDLMVRSDLDSAGLVTEPTLQVWGVPFYSYESDADLPRVARAWNRARREERPVALLLEREFK